MFCSHNVALYVGLLVYNILLLFSLFPISPFVIYLWFFRNLCLRFLSLFPIFSILLCPFCVDISIRYFFFCHPLYMSIPYCSFLISPAIMFAILIIHCYSIICYPFPFFLFTNPFHQYYLFILSGSEYPIV